MTVPRQDKYFCLHGVPVTHTGKIKGIDLSSLLIALVWVSSFGLTLQAVESATEKLGSEQALTQCVSKQNNLWGTHLHKISKPKQGQQSDDKDTGGLQPLRIHAPRRQRQNGRLKARKIGLKISTKPRHTSAYFSKPAKIDFQM